MKRVLLVFTMSIALATAASASLETFDSISSDWVNDRTEPATFQAVTFDGDSRIQQGVDAADQTSDSFHNYQGKMRLLEAGTTEVSIDIYISSDWANQTNVSRRNASIWLNGWDGVNDQLAWNIIAFNINDQGGLEWKTWVDEEETAGWIATSIDESNFDFGWHNLNIKFLGDSVVYSIDSEILATDNLVDENMIGYKGVYLQTYNFGETYNDVYWDNLESVPEPATIALLGIGGLLLRRRRA